MDGELKQWPDVATEFLQRVRKERGVGAEARIIRDLKKLAVKRHALRDITKPLGHGLIELTTTHDGMEYRCVYVFHHPHIVVLVCFEKKTRKTPPHVIDLARERHAELLKEEISVGTITLH